MKFHLWFDPTKDFHHYAILWRPNEIMYVNSLPPIIQFHHESIWVRFCLNHSIFLFISVFRFLVDDIPIRRYPRKSATTFPLRPMWLYGSIWDASSWATEDGKYRADYRYQPFVAKYTNFKAGGCSAYSPAWCRPVSASPFRSGGLTRQQKNAMKWVQSHQLVYNYCWDNKRDHSLTPECWH